MRDRITHFEQALAAAAFAVAAILAFASMMISEDHDIAAGVLMAVAQFLLLTASILHIDYKIYQYGHTITPKRNPKQQPTELAEDC